MDEFAPTPYGFSQLAHSNISDFRLYNNLGPNPIGSPSPTRFSPLLPSPPNPRSITHLPPRRRRSSLDGDIVYSFLCRRISEFVGFARDLELPVQHDARL
ncbi:hypothetical protein AKJ16_DCAP10240 [Drosera capensis]